MRKLNNLVRVLVKNILFFLCMFSVGFIPLTSDWSRSKGRESEKDNYHVKGHKHLHYV